MSRPPRCWPPCVASNFPRPASLGHEEEQFKAPIREQYENQGNPYYSTARLWDDGIIDPADTRTVVGLALSVCAYAPVESVSYGVFRM
ncbi:carboxyl transferase domain protein [Mycobacterium ulcerans str. Harvey]|uniref:Carboxyl transferase domain protein n=1 Tax=Mycobacterium ulcerans str. Harvey TaxID=1299332 RepID=A0ABN0QS17_MYCUL|nr:carboxyl transferase domain protein [Mycobacterium ulcerans str. Harvey]